MKKKPKVIKLDRFRSDKCYSYDLPYIKYLCRRFGTKRLNSEWDIYWRELNTANKVMMIDYFDDYILCTDSITPYVYLLRVMVLHDFCRLHGYKLEDIKYE